jgi:hypothetical protein
MHAEEIASFNEASANLKLRFKEANPDELLTYYARTNGSGQFLRSPYHLFSIRENMISIIEERKLQSSVPPAVEERFKDIKYLTECHIKHGNYVFFIEWVCI